MSDSWDPMDCSLPGSSVLGILQARILSELPFPSPEDFPNPGIEPRSPALQANSLLTELWGKPLCWLLFQMATELLGHKCASIPTGTIKKSTESLKASWAQQLWEILTNIQSQLGEGCSKGKKLHVQQPWSEGVSDIFRPMCLFIIRRHCYSWGGLAQEDMAERELASSETHCRPINLILFSEENSKGFNKGWDMAWVVF